MLEYLNARKFTVMIACFIAGSMPLLSGCDMDIFGPPSSDPYVPPADIYHPYQGNWEFTFMGPWSEQVTGKISPYGYWNEIVTRISETDTMRYEVRISFSDSGSVDKGQILINELVGNSWRYRTAGNISGQLSGNSGEGDYNFYQTPGTWSASKK